MSFVLRDIFDLADGLQYGLFARIDSDPYFHCFDVVTKLRI